MASVILVDEKGRNYTEKDPDAVLDYSFDWSEWLSDSQDEIINQEIIAEGGLSADNITQANGVVSVFVSGGSVGVGASITCRIVTLAGRTDDRTLFFKIKEK